MDISQYFQYYNCLKLDVEDIQTDAQTRIQLMANNVPETTATSRREIPVFIGRRISFYKVIGGRLTSVSPEVKFQSGNGGYSSVDCTCNFIDSDSDCKKNICSLRISHDKTTLEHPKSDHVFVKYSKSGSSLSSMYSLCQKVRFQFSPTNDCCKVKKCGVHPVNSEYKEESGDRHRKRGSRKGYGKIRIKKHNIVYEVKSSLTNWTDNC
ncbi:hypothetical protein QYF36_023037 [Acer negundo]|nr:hypothetical protein QYF36_023037 [Acer negundo]